MDREDTDRAGMWTDDVREILGGDLAVALAYRTPAGGVVVMPVTTLGAFDAARGTVSTSSSLGNFTKLLRIEADPRVALAYHTRDHGSADAPRFVLVQGDAAFPDRQPKQFARMLEDPKWEKWLPARKHGIVWDRVGREYYDYRVPIVVDVARILVWDGLDAAGTPTVTGRTLPAGDPEPQSPPAKGTEPRVAPGKYRKRLDRSRHRLVGYGGVDGYPVVLPVGTSLVDDRLLLDRADLPAGGRRAGFLAHWFEPRLVGQGSVIATGWLDCDGDGRALYSPHTVAGYAVPPRELVFSLGGGLAAKFGYRKAVRRGLVRDGVWIGAGNEQAAAP